MNHGGQYNTFMLCRSLNKQMLIQLVIQPVGSKKILTVSLSHFESTVTLQTQHTRLHQFTQHRHFLHSSISHNKHGHSTVTSCHGSMFICCCTLAFCPFCLLFCCCVCLTPSLCFFLSIPFSTNSSHRFSHFFFASPTTPCFCLPPPHD